MTAKEMFKELGYTQLLDDVNYVVYSFDFKYEIRFYKPHQDIAFIYSDPIYNTLDIEELQAINKQVEELGWNNE